MKYAIKEFNKTKDKVVDDLKSIVSDAEDLLHATAQLSGESFSAERAKFSEKLKNAKTRLTEVEHRVFDKAKQAATATDHYVHSNPWTAVGTATAVGLLIGFMAARR